MNSKSLKIFAFLGVVSALVLLQDFLRFAWTCRNYGQQARQGLSQLSSADPLKTRALVVLTGDKNRIPRALELLQSNPDFWLFISGVSKKTSLSEMAAIHGEAGKPQPEKLWERVIIDSEATSTVQNAEETEKLVQTKQLPQIVLITSDYHMLRALNIFKKRVSSIIIPYAVTSEFTEGSLVKLPEGLFKFLFEYWKWIAFRLDIY